MDKNVTFFDGLLMYIFGDKMYAGVKGFHIILGLLGVCKYKSFVRNKLLFSRFHHSSNVYKDEGCYILYLGIKSMR